MDRDKIKEYPATTRNQMQKVERLLSDCKQHEREELQREITRKGQKLISKERLRDVLKVLGEVYGEDNKIVFYRTPCRYKLDNGTELAFCENLYKVVDEKAIVVYNKLLAVFDGALPFEKLLVHLRLRESEVRDVFHGIIDLEGNNNLDKWITKLYDAMVDKKLIVLSYMSLASKKVDKVVVSPNYLRNFENRWALIAKIDGKPYDWSIFALDRIVQVEKYVGNRTFEVIDRKRIDDYYKHVIGYYVPVHDKGNPPTILSADRLKQECVKVVFKVTNPHVEEFIKRNPIHKHSQIYRPDGTFELCVVKNQLLLSKLIKYGTDLEVLEPVSLIEEIRDFAARLVDMYKTRF